MPRRDDDDFDDDDRDNDDDDRKETRKRGKPSKDEKQMAMLCHLGLIIGGFILPLILWMTKKEESRFIDWHGKEALNFGITLMIGHVIGPFTLCILNVVIGIMGIVFAVQAAMAANRGEYYRYSMSIRFIK